MSTAEKLRNQADKLTAKIHAKENSGTSQQRLTRRRANIIAGQIAAARILREQQTALYVLADAHDNGTIDPVLRWIKSRTQVETILMCHTFPHHDTEEKRMRKASITPDNYMAARQALQVLAYDPETKKRNALKKAELELVNHRIPGFFPTPPDIVSLMLEYAEVEPNMKILEPSAGKGDIADAIKLAYPSVDLDCYEINPALQQILELKGHKVLGFDFLKVGVEHYQKYDRVIMNPPFERFQDIEHVRHAYRALKDGGKLVAIMSEGTFFRRDGIAASFRTWLKGKSWVHQLPQNSFKSSGTGVNARIVVIDKSTYFSF